jgi:2-iminobutanoate/2-iminopropanoate deaminase
MTYRKLLACCIIAGALAGQAVAAGVTKFTLPPGKDGKPSRILEAAEIPPNASVLYLSGQLAAPIDPARTGSSPTIADFGDSRTQTLSVLAKIRRILESHGYAMADIVKMTLFVAPDPKLGRMDFDGVNAGFAEFFNTAANPTTTTRSAFQVAALAAPQYLIEIEVVAAKVK